MRHAVQSTSKHVQHNETHRKDVKRKKEGEHLASTTRGGEIKKKRDASELPSTNKQTNHHQPTQLTLITQSKGLNSVGSE